MTKKAVEETLAQLEETQAALRQSIAQAKELADESDRMVRKHRKEAQPKPPNPAS